MAGNNNWYTHYSTFEEDQGVHVPIIAQGRDPRFFDDTQPVFSRDLLLGSINVLSGFQISDWGEDRWPRGRTVKNRFCDHMPVLHFVVDGKGTLNGQTIRKGTAFVTDPKIPYSMSTDTKDPILYFWVRTRVELSFFESLDLFTFGSDGCGRFDFSPCIDDVTRLFRKGLNMNGDGIAMQLGISSLFFEILSRCMQHTPKSEGLSPYVTRSLDYIRAHYAEDVNVNQLAEPQHISRNHLRRLFLRDLGLTPKEQITQCRMDVAVTLLDSGSNTMNLTQIAAAVGYPSYSQFIQAFRKTYGCTPKNYKNKV